MKTSIAHVPNEEETVDPESKVSEKPEISEVDKLRFRLLGEQLKSANMEIEFYKREVEVAGMRLKNLQKEQAAMINEFREKYGPAFLKYLQK